MLQVYYIIELWYHRPFKILTSSATCWSSREQQSSFAKGGLVREGAGPSRMPAMRGNNNMGKEVDWRDMKQLVPASATLATFCCSASEEYPRPRHWTRRLPLSAGPTQNISVHVKAPEVNVWSGAGNSSQDAQLLCDCEEQAKPRGEFQAPHRNYRCSRERHCISRSRRCTMSCQRSVAQSPTCFSWTRLLICWCPANGSSSPSILTGSVQSAMSKSQGLTDFPYVLEIYESFVLITRKSTRGKYPAGCTCRDNSTDCLCDHVFLTCAAFDETVQVPTNWVAKTPELRKKTNCLRGTAGPRSINCSEPRQNDRDLAIPENCDP